MDRPHSGSLNPIGEGGGGPRRRPKQLSQHNLQALQASTAALHAPHYYDAGFLDGYNGPRQYDASMFLALRRYTQGEAKEDPFPLYAKGAQNAAYNPEHHEQHSAVAQGKRRERSVSIPQESVYEGGTKRHCSTSAGTEARTDFACPYHKRFSRQMLTLGSCTHAFSSSTRVKEHLLRAHSLKKAEAGNKTSANARTSNPEMVFGSKEHAALKQRSKRHTSEAQKWEAFWRILFPDMAAQGNIPSPYLDDEDASGADKDQLESFKEMQYRTLPEKVQKRFAEETGRLNHTNTDLVDELIGMLPELMRDVMKESGFTPGNDTRANTPSPNPSSFSVTADSAIRGHSGLQTTSTPQQPTAQNSANGLMFPGDALQTERLGHPQGIHLDTSNDSAYFSAEMEARQQPPKPPMEDAEDYHSQQVPSMSSYDGSSAANNYPGYSPWGSDSLMTSFMQPGLGHAGVQDRSPTDFAGGWANDETLGHEGEPIADFDLNEFLYEQGTQTDYALSTPLHRAGLH